MGRFGNLGGCGTATHVFVQTGFDQSLDVSRYLPTLVIEPHLAVGLVASALLTEGHTVGENLEQCHPKSIDVAFGAWGLVDKSFGCHIGQCAAVGVVQLAMLACGADAKVGDGIVALVIDEHIGGFDVLMDDGRIVGVQIGKPRSHVLDILPDVGGGSELAY